MLNTRYNDIFYNNNKRKKNPVDWAEGLPKESL